MANAFGFNIARSVGPAIGGVIVVTLSKQRELQFDSARDFARWLRFG